MFSALIWNKCVIMLETFSSSIKNDSGVKECFWKITKITAPICLLEKSDEMIEIIKQNFLWKRIISFKKISEKIHNSILWFFLGILKGVYHEIHIGYSGFRFFIGI